MKKITFLIVFSMLVSIGFAQQIPTNFTGKKPLSTPQKFVTHSKTSSSFYIDYDWADFKFIYGGDTTLYNWYGWNMNMHYVAADSSWKYCVVAFDSIHDYVNQIGYLNNNITSFKVDSIIFNFGHYNTSGQNDTLIIKIIKLDSNGYPQLTQVLWRDTLIGTMLDNLDDATHPGWLYFGTVRVAPDLTITPEKRFGVVLEYYGNLADTAGFLAGFPFFMGPCPTGNYALAMRSSFYPNSFVLWTQYASYGILPTATGGDIYYDCNNNGNYDEGTDGANYIQNICIWAYVTIDVTDIEENITSVLHLSQNQPNPAVNKTFIQYELAKNSFVTLEIYDIIGKKIMAMDEGQKHSGKHSVILNTENLDNGFYFYTLIANGEKLTRKMAVLK